MKPAPLDNLRTIRYGTQAFFLLLSAWTGYRFHEFVLWCLDPSRPFTDRPPSVDAFLPIGGLMSVKYFLLTGIIEPIHPAGFFIFLSVMAVAMVAKKGFCGWICPVGTISQVLWMTGEKIFGKKFAMPAWLDFSLRSVKYLLLFLFILLIGIAMTPNMMVLFFITDYYKTADVQTMRFFTDMSGVALGVLIGLAGLSMLYKNFWCRYLCPYGALLGLLSMASPFKIRRDEKKCMHCHACTRHCPSGIDVEREGVVSSPECFGCLTCVSRCKAPGALDLSLGRRKTRRTVSPYLLPGVMILVFYGVISIGVATDNWRSKIPLEEYRRVVSGVYAGEAAGNPNAPQAGASSPPATSP